MQLQMQMLDAMDGENKILGKSKATYLVIRNIGFFRNMVIVGWQGIQHSR